MNDFNNIGRRMPFIEDKDYVDRLVDRCTVSAPAEADIVARSSSIGIASA